MIQNADDAQATTVQIRFRSSNSQGWTEPMAKTVSTAGTKSKTFNGVSICNNGFVFRPEDFARIKSICDGNPDETKIGFFG